MIVAARATRAQAEKGLAEVVNRVVNRQVHLFVARAEAARHSQITGGDDLLLVIFGKFVGLLFFCARRFGFVFFACGQGTVHTRRMMFGEQVTGDLFTDELIVGFVAVERIDHIVAITIGRRHRIIRIIARRVGVARQIKPMPAPLLAISR